LALIARASIAACRSRNGASAGGLASDPYLNDPLDCDFDPAVLTCKGGDAEECLTGEQVAALKRMYDGARNPRTGERIYFGWPFGSEAGWSLYWADPSNPAAPARASFWQLWVFDKSKWDWRRFDFDRDLKRADDALAPVINAMSANLDSFRRRGGKLLQYHGMADPVVPFADSIVYRERVMGGDTDEFYRLFLAPGLAHCQGGPGPAPEDLQPVMERWVEQGVAPERLLATAHAGGSTGKGFTRPLCPYPSVARYDGHGSPDDAASFTCSAPTHRLKIEQPAAEYLR
jgi:feruloyl esterase